MDLIMPKKISSKPYKKLATLFLSCIGLSMSFSTQVSATTLKEAVAHALCTGPDIGIVSHNREAIQAEVRQALAGYYPTVDLSAGYGREYANNLTTQGETSPGPGQLGAGITLWRSELGIVIRQMLFDGFAVKYDVKGKKARLRAQSWRVNSEAERIALDVSETFLNINLQKKLVIYAQQNVATHLKIYKQIQQRAQGGVSRQADFEQVTGRLASARANLLAVEANLRDAQTKYLKLVGIPAANLTEPVVASTSLPASLGVAIAQGIQRHPELRAATTDVLVTKAAKELAKSAFFPTLHVELIADDNHNVAGSIGITSDASAMLRARWNVFRGGGDLANVKQKAQKIEEAKEVRNRSHRETEETVRLAWSLYETAISQIPQFEIHMTTVHKVLQAYYQQFDIGQRTLLDLLDTENEVLRAQNDYATGLHNKLVGSYRIFRGTGCLLDHFGIPQPYAARLS